MAERYAKLLLIPEDGGRLRQCRVRLWPLPVLIATALLSIAFFVGAGAIYLHTIRSREAFTSLRYENETLRSELVMMDSRIARLDATVRRHINLANESRLLAGLPPYGEEVALLGVGGTLDEGLNLPQGGLSPALERTVEAFQDRLDQLSRQLVFQEESFIEVKQLIEANRDRLDHIPTVNPVLGRHYVSSGFGMRRDPFTGQRVHHNGIDFCAQRGTPFRATANGVVIFAGRNGSFGKTIKIDHNNGYVTIYGHCNKLLVKKGQRTHRGDVIGEVGHTGRSTGDHLHYEIRQNDRPVNPRRYLLETEAFVG